MMCVRDKMLFCPSVVDGRILVYAVAGLDRTYVGALSGHTDFVRALCLSSRGLLVSGGADGSMRCWDANPHALARLSDTSKASGDDGDAHLDAAAVQQQRQALERGARAHCLRALGAANGGHAAPVTAIAKLRGRVFTASEDRTIRVWQ